MRSRNRILGVLIAAGALLIVAAAVAAAAISGSAHRSARAPKHAEREAITRALPRGIRNTPVECLLLHERVSGNPRYAYVGLEYLNATKPGSRCIRYASDGFYVLKKAPTWKVVYNGSVDPSCALKIPRDLTPCR